VRGEATDRPVNCDLKLPYLSNERNAIHSTATASLGHLNGPSKVRYLSSSRRLSIPFGGNIDVFSLRGALA
jgi:hypothetical protein